MNINPSLLIYRSAFFLDCRSSAASQARVSLARQLLRRLQLNRTIDVPKVKEVSCRVDENTGFLAFSLPMPK